MRRHRKSNEPIDQVLSKDLQFNVRLTQRQNDLLTAGAAHMGATPSSYLRWLIEVGTPQVLEGPSKHDKLKALEQHFHSLLPPLEQLPPPKPLPSPPKHVDVRPAPLYWEGPKAAQKAAAAPPAPVPLPPALPDLLPLTAAPVPTEEPPEWFRLRADDPRPAELPDDMSDWT